MPAAKREDGAVLVEFALVLPLLLLLVLGIMQFGVLFNAKINETHLASSAARYAAVNQTPGDVSLVDYIKSIAGTAYLRNNAQVCVEYPTDPEDMTSGEPGDPVTVRITTSYDLFSFLGEYMTDTPASIPVVGDATMRLETFPDAIPAGCTA